MHRWVSPSLLLEQRHFSDTLTLLPIPSNSVRTFIFHSSPLFRSHSRLAPSSLVLRWLSPPLSLSLSPPVHYVDNPRMPYIPSRSNGGCNHTLWQGEPIPVHHWLLERDGGAFPHAVCVCVCVRAGGGAGRQAHKAVYEWGSLAWEGSGEKGGSKGKTLMAAVQKRAERGDAVSSWQSVWVTNQSHFSNLLNIINTVWNWK